MPAVLSVPPVPVAVVGAGPTGVMVAALLAQQGIPVLVLDRWSQVFPQPRAVHLDDEVYRLLARLGLAEAFASVSRPALGMRLLDRRHRVLAEFRRDPQAGVNGHPQANMFDQPDLERLLRQALGRSPSVTLLGNAEVTEVIQRPDGAQVSWTDRVRGAMHQVQARYVLGCDGAHSLVRAAIGARMRDHGFAQRWLVVDVATAVDLDTWDGVHQVCDPDRPATFLRVGSQRYRWEFRLRDGETAQPHADPAALLALLAPWTGGLPAERLRILRCAEYTFRAQVADRWRDRRVLLLGDAAHLTPPFVGQGLGMGLRDAANLAWKLAGVLRGELGDPALDSYQRERRRHATTMVRQAVLIGHAMTAGGRPGALLREVLAPRLSLVPGLRAAVLDSTTPGLPASALVRRPFGGRLPGHRPLGSGLPGRLVPNVRLSDGRRVDEVAPAGFLVITRQVLSPAQRERVQDRGATLLRTAPGEDLDVWLRRGRAEVAAVRPDAVVLAAGTAPTVLAQLPWYHPP